jgi:peptidoglycan/LPS O-acetylase OafA/YrhL
MTERTPPPLRTSIGARLVNVFAVAAALAALSSVLVHKTMRETEDPIEAFFGTAVPTFVFAAAWALLLRVNGGLERARLPLRVVASIVGLAYVTLFLVFWGQSSLFLGFQAFAVPAFVVGVVAMVWAHHERSPRLFVPDDNREAVVGKTAGALAAIALAFLFLLPEKACAWPTSTCSTIV